MSKSASFLGDGTDGMACTAFHISEICQTIICHKEYMRLFFVVVIHKSGSRPISSPDTCVDHAFPVVALTHGGEEHRWGDGSLRSNSIDASLSFFIPG